MKNKLTDLVTGLADLTDDLTALAPGQTYCATGNDTWTLESYTFYLRAARTEVITTVNQSMTGAFVQPGITFNTQAEDMEAPAPITGSPGDTIELPTNLNRTGYNFS